MNSGPELQMPSSEVRTDMETSSTYIIAEAGVNHNGNIDIAIELIHEASRCGADAVKFQTFKADEIVTMQARKAPYQVNNTGGDESQYQMLKQLELDFSQFQVLKEECEKSGIDFLSTPYNHCDVDILEELNVHCYKIASAMAVEPDFLAYVAKTGKKIILSTGMCTMEEVSCAVHVIKQATTAELVLLQCTTDYPSSNSECNLRAMLTMQNEFDVPIGYSDHTPDHTSAIVAVALGASVIEKHFTLDKTLPGPDHSASCNPAELSEYIDYIRETEVILGSKYKQPSSSELQNRPMMRRGVVAKNDISAGTVLQSEHIAYKRPETELKAAEAVLIIGKTAKNDINKDMELKKEDFI